MRSIQTNPMIFMSDRLSVAFSFSRRAHLLTTCKAGGGIPPVGRARALFTNCLSDSSPEGGRQCRKRTFPVQSALYFALSAKRWGGILPPHPAACLRKPATGSFYAVMGISFPATPIFSFQKRNRKKGR